MPSTVEEWDDRHQRNAAAGQSEPAPILRELSPLFPKGPALDLACGRGGNAIFLAERGIPVTAVDWSPAGLQILEREARQRELPVRRSPSGRFLASASHGISTVCADLESIGTPHEEYALVVCIRFLDRRILRKIPEMLTSGGMTLIETFTKAQLAFETGPKDSAFLLELGELRTGLPGLRTIFYRELRAGQGIATLLASKVG